MSEDKAEIQINSPVKIHPTAERIEHLRHQIKERKPQARRIFNRSGTIPTERELINAAGDQLRKELESDYDVLTGLLDRKGYEKQKKIAIQKSINEGLPTSVAVIDLDNLKTTNDTLGHDAGDNYLKSAGDALKAVSRQSDIPARVGGDEFQVLLINTTPQLASAWKKRVIDEFNSRGVDASIGISAVNLEDVDNSVKIADRKMYKEKRQKKAINGNQ